MDCTISSASLVGCLCVAACSCCWVCIAVQTFAELEGNSGAEYVWVDCQVVTDKMWEGRAARFPEHTPTTREYYLLRSIFEEQFPSQQAMATVPKVHFIAVPAILACSLLLLGPACEPCHLATASISVPYRCSGPFEGGASSAHDVCRPWLCQWVLHTRRKRADCNCNGAGHEHSVLDA